jgi:hypothetical protein
MNKYCRALGLSELLMIYYLIRSAACRWKDLFWPQARTNNNMVREIVSEGVLNFGNIWEIPSHTSTQRIWGSAFDYFILKISSSMFRKYVERLSSQLCAQNDASEPWLRMFPRSILSVASFSPGGGPQQAPNLWDNDELVSIVGTKPFGGVTEEVGFYVHAIIICARGFYFCANGWPYRSNAFTHSQCARLDLQSHFMLAVSNHWDERPDVPGSMMRELFEQGQIQELEKLVKESWEGWAQKIQLQTRNRVLCTLRSI